MAPSLAGRDPRCVVEFQIALDLGGKRRKKVTAEHPAWAHCRSYVEQALIVDQVFDRGPVSEHCAAERERREDGGVVHATVDKRLCPVSRRLRVILADIKQSMIGGT